MYLALSIRKLKAFQTDTIHHYPWQYYFLSNSLKYRGIIILNMKTFSPLIFIFYYFFLHLLLIGDCFTLPLYCFHSLNPPYLREV